MAGNSTRSISDYIDYIWQGISIIASSTCLFLMLAEIFVRYILRRPLMGIEEVTCMIAFWAYFMGAVHGTFEKSHIQAQIIQVFIKDLNKLNIINAATSFITAFIASTISLWAYDYLVWGIQRGEKSPFLLIPRVYSQSAISIGLILMTVYFIIHFIKDLRIALIYRLKEK